MEIRRRGPDDLVRLPSLALRHRAGDGDAARTRGPRIRRSGRGKGDARRHAHPLGEGELHRGHVDHRAARRAHLRCEAVAPGPAAAHHHDRHRLRGARVGDAARHSDGQVLDLFGHRQQDRQARKPRARLAPQSARTRSRSWCRAIACSAAPATSRAITGGSPASARCSAGRRGKWRRLNIGCHPGRAQREPGSIRQHSRT